MADSTPQGSITSVTPFTRFQPGVGPQEGYNVNFITSKGQPGTVFVPTAQITDSVFVQSQVNALADSLHSVLNLNVK